MSSTGKLLWLINICFLILMCLFSSTNAEMRRNKDCEIVPEIIRSIAQQERTKMGECMAKDNWYNSMITDCEKCDVVKCQDNGDCLMQCNAFFKEQSTMEAVNFVETLLFVTVAVVLIHAVISTAFSCKQHCDTRGIKNENKDRKNKERQEHPTNDRDGDCEDTRLVIDNSSLSSDSGTELSRFDLLETRQNQQHVTRPVQDSGAV